MRAQLLRLPSPIDQQPLSLAELPNPIPSAGQILIHISTCGVCHTDLHIAEGEIAVPRLPIIPGHQVVGRVAALGPDVTNWSIGDRAGVPWLHRTCGACEYCRRGEENLCPHAEFTGLHHNGGFADYIVANADFTVRIPESFDEEHAAPLLCAGIIGYRSLCKAEVQPGETLGLFGFGASAHLALQVARYWHCRVFVFTRSPTHRQQARDLGAEWAGSAEDSPPSPLDRAVIFAPAGVLVPLALEKLRAGGTLAINAIHMSPIPQLPYELLYGERTVRSVANATRSDAREFLDLAAKINIRVEVQPFAFEEANAALGQLKRGEITGAGVLVIHQ